MCHKVGAVYLVTRSVAAGTGQSIDVRELDGSEDAALAFPINATVVHRCAEACLRLAGVEMATDDLTRLPDDAAVVAVTDSNAGDSDQVSPHPPTHPPTAYFLYP